MGELYNPYPKLPKNIRQVGERDQIVRLYVEDYVNTYLKRLYPSGGRALRVGLLLGDVYQADDCTCVFVDGALEMPEAVTTGENVELTEGVWNDAYRNMDQLFPKRNVCGWFLCGAPGSTLSPLNYWKDQQKFFSGKGQVMYLNCGLEGEESVYIASEEGFYKLRGHCIYYERNQMMQDYMVMQKDVRRVESNTDDTVTRDFRLKMEKTHGQMSSYRHTIGVLGTFCTAFAIAALAGGVVVFRDYHKMQEMQSVITSVLPKQSLEIEEVPGGVRSSRAMLQIEQESETTTGETMSGESEVDTTPSTETWLSETVPAETVETAPAETQVSALPVLPEGSYDVHLVESGETLYGICLNRYHSVNRIEEICQVNGLDSQDHITAGQELKLPK